MAPKYEYCVNCGDAVLIRGNVNQHSLSENDTSIVCKNCWETFSKFSGIAYADAIEMFNREKNKVSTTLTKRGAEYVDKYLEWLKDHDTYPPLKKDDTVLFEVESISGKSSLVLKKDALVLFEFKKEKIIPIQQIIAVEGKPPKSKWKNGFIKFHLGGAPDSFLKLTSFLTLANDKDITFYYNIDYAEDVEKIKEYISNYKTSGTNETLQTKPSVVDEIKKGKELLDAGAITEEEFQALKDKLLK